MRYHCLQCRRKFRFAILRSWHILATLHVRYEKEELDVKYGIDNSERFEMPKTGLDKYIELW